jgi:hypothetical protein
MTIKNQNAYADMIAAFNAKGGKVQTVESGIRAIESDRTIYAAMREGKKVAGDSERATRLSEGRHEQAQQAHWAGDHAFGYEVSAGLHDSALD